MTDNVVNIPDYIPVLSHGGHSNPKNGACVMEMVSFIAGEEWSDRPATVYDTLAEIARRTNDFVSDDNRSVIADLIPRFIGTDKLKDHVTPTQYGGMIAMAYKSDEVLGRWNAGPQTLITKLKNDFQNNKNMETRLSNEEYDLHAMRGLKIALDVADRILERGEYAVTKEEAFAKVATLDNQKEYVRAK